MAHGSLLRIRPRPTPFADLVDPAPALGPEHHWEGVLYGEGGFAAGHEMPITAQIAFHGYVIEGSGRVTGRLADKPELQGTFALSGTLTGEAVAFRIWLPAEAVRKVSFDLDGQITADHREMTGQWSVPCFNPEDCGCDGARGRFQLKRIGGT